MFNTKKKELFASKKVVNNTSGNAFTNAGLKETAVTRSGNGAIKYSKTSNDFVTQFGSAGSWKVPREYKDIANDMAILYSQDKLTTIKFVFYLRTITRQTNLPDNTVTETVQRGQGLKHEAIFRMLWLAINDEQAFWKNIPYFIAIGSWKDIITMLSYDLQWNGWSGRLLDWEEFGRLILIGLENPNSSELIKKYLPAIKATSKAKTIESQADTLIGKWICSLLFGNKGEESGHTYKKYRQLKSNGIAHQWQQLISQGKHRLIDFNTIHGRALSLLVSSNYLRNQGLTETYARWIADRPVAKFTGYVHELAANITNGLHKYQADTINAQYNQLLERAGKGGAGFIVVKDTSTSMNSTAYGVNMSSYNVAKAMSIMLANILTGYFANHYIDFSSKAILRQVQGRNFVEHWQTEKREPSANTNFLAVAELLVSILKQGVNEKDFPKGIICLSDGEFDRVKMFDITNISAFMRVLRDGGFSKTFVDNFQIAFWDIHNTFYSRNRTTKFETFNITKNVFYFSGYDPSVITFLTGIEGKSTPPPSNAEELFKAAMDQEVLNLLTI